MFRPLPTWLICRPADCQTTNVNDFKLALVEETSLVWGVKTLEIDVNHDSLSSKNFNAIAPCVVAAPARKAAAKNAVSTNSSRDAPRALAAFVCTSMQ